MPSLQLFMSSPQFFMLSLQFNVFITIPCIHYNSTRCSQPQLQLVFSSCKKPKTYNFIFPTTNLFHERSLVVFFHTQGLTWTIMFMSFKVACKLTSMFWHKIIWLPIKLWLDCSASCNQNGPSLFSNPTPHFLLPIVIKCNRSTKMKTEALFDFNASTCFINKELVQ